MKEAIRRRARELGFDSCRFTTAAPPLSAPKYQRWLADQRHGAMAYLESNSHKRMDPQQVLSGARSFVCVAASYAQPQPASSASNSQPGGIVARYARYSDYHDVMGQRLAELAAFTEALGGGTARSLWYVDTGPVLERDIAQRAGVGFIGKHTNVISRILGNWILLGEIITTLELPPDEQEHNRCGSCARCLTACPTGAITAPFQLDARRCVSYLTIELKGAIPVEWRPFIGNRIFGCDDCLAACPWNRFAREGALMKPHSRLDLATPPLLQLLAIDDPEFKRRFSGTPILRSKRRGLLRNVCVALGNTGDTSALPALHKAASEPDEFIGEHASWAIQQILSRSTEPNSAPQQGQSVQGRAG